MNNTVRYAFEPFAKIELGQPIKIMPVGKFYRGKRILEVTKDRLQEIVKNFQTGLPRFRVGFNLDHEENSGKVGDVKNLAYLDDGPQGSGLYATQYELSEKGKKAIEEDGYDGTSAEVVWTLNNGAKYQDPESGTETDNVLVGVAFTPKPFFGHKHVALYTADVEKAQEIVEIYRPYGGATTFEEYDEWVNAQAMADQVRWETETFRMLIDNILERLDINDKAKAIADLASEYEARIKNVGSEKMSVIDKIKHLLSADETLENVEYFRKFTAEQRKELAKEGKALPDGSYPIVTKQDLQNAIQAYGRGGSKAQVKKHIIKRAKALGASDMLPENWEAEVDAEILEAEEVEEMATEIVEEPKEELVDTQEVEKMAEELKVSKEHSEKLEAELKGIRDSQRKERMKSVAESFKALPVEVDEFTEKMLALEDADPEVAKWVGEKFGAIEKALVEAGLLKEIGSELDADLPNTERFLQMVESKVKEGSDYGDALAEVAKAEPELAEAYYKK